MKLYLARHGDYGLDASGLDVLSEKGIHDITQMARSLKHMNLQVLSVLHSSKNRTMQTAALLAQGFSCEESPQLHPGLEPDDDVLGFINELVHWDEDILIVGHLPFMRKLVSQLLIGNDKKEIVHFHTGTLVLLSQVDKSHWMIDWVLTPTLVTN